MRDKTRKLLKICTLPVRLTWVGLTVVVGYSGMFLVMLAYVMLGDIQEAKRVFTTRL